MLQLVVAFIKVPTCRYTMQIKSCFIIPINIRLSICVVYVWQSCIS